MVDRIFRPIVPLTHANEVEHRRMLAQRASACLPKDGTEAMTAPLPLAPITSANLPTASLHEGEIVYVDDANTVAFSNGTSWSTLADRYTAGSFTPVYQTTGVGFTAVTYDANRWGRYTLIGRECHFRLRLATDAITIGAATGNLIVAGLPFTAADLVGVTAGFQAVTVAFRSGFAATPPISALIDEGTSFMELFHLTAITAASASCPAATTVGTGVDQNLLYIGGSYQVSD